MKTTLFVFAAVVLLSIPVLSQDTHDEMMKTAIEMGKPGKAHEKLGFLEGDWEMDIKTWMDPTGAPMKSTAVSENRYILDGRFMQMNGTGEVFGENVEYITFIGYDNRFKKYFLFGIDTFGTYMICCDGEYDEENGKYTFAGTDIDTMSGQEYGYRFVIQTLNENEFLYEIYFDFKGMNEFKVNELIYKRKKM